MIRSALLSDTEAILSVYAGYIDTTITFECALPSVFEFRSRVQTISADYPYLVWEEDGRVLGYAYAHRYREREAYQWGAELSIYIDRRVQSKGVGRALYTELIHRLRAQGVKTVYGCITLPNEKSVRLHESLGFTAAGVFHNAGYKNGAWHDVIWYEKAIAPYDTPAPIQKQTREEGST